MLQPGGQPGVTGAPRGVLQPGGQPGVTGAHQGALQPGEQLGAIGAPQREQQPGGQPGVTGAPLGVLQPGGRPGVTGAPRGVLRPGGQPGVTGAPLGVLQPGEQLGVTGAPLGVLQPGGQPGVIGAPLGVLQPGGAAGGDRSTPGSATARGAAGGDRSTPGSATAMGAAGGDRSTPGSATAKGAAGGDRSTPERAAARGAAGGDWSTPGSATARGAAGGDRSTPGSATARGAAGGGQPGVTGVPLGVLQPGEQLGVTGAPLGVLQPGGQPGVTGAPQELLLPRGQPGLIGAPLGVLQPGGQSGVTGAPQGALQPGEQLGAIGAPQREQQPGGQPGVTGAPLGVLQPGGQPGVTGAPQGVLQPGGQPGATGAPLGVLQPGGQPGVTGAPQIEQQPGGQSLDDREQQLEEWCRLLEFDTPMATAEESEADKEPPMQPSTCPRFPCDTCFHTFATRGAAANHMRVCRAAEAERRAQALGSTPSLVETDTQERPTPREFGDEAWAGVTSWKWEAFFSVEAVGGRTVRRIPQRARSGVLDALCCVLKRLKSRPGDEAATLLLLAFPRLILAVPPKPGIGQKALIIERLGAFWEGRWRELFDSAMVAARPAVRPLAYTCSDQDLDAIRLSRCQSRCKVGEWSRELACLTTGELARPSEAMVQSLREKHPAGTSEVPQWVRDFTVDAPQRPPLTADILARTIHTAARASAAGPSGWVTEHLRDTFLTEPSCLSHLLEVFNQWVAGQQQVMESVTREFRDLLFLSYADDTYILGPAARILEAFGVLRERLEWVGLEVQAHKCRFWEREGGDVERALPLGMQRVEEGLTVVGVPIGEEGWEAARDIAQLGVAGEEAMFAEYLTTSAGAEFLDPWFAKALEQLPATIRQEMPGLPLCVAAPPLRLFQARQRLFAGPGAGAWVSAVPAHSDLTFTAAEWGIAAAIRLGLPIQQLQVTGRCVCGTAYVDPADPHHALRCKHQHGPSRVHDEVKFAVAKISKASGGVVTMEDSVVLQGKRVDVAVRRPMAGEAHALEISVADPLSLSPSLLGQCGRQIGVAAREWERRKTSDYAPLLARNRGVQFTPLIVETWGCLGGRFRRWLRQQGDAHVGLAVSRGACREDDTVFSAYLLGSLKALIVVALQRAQARVILLRAASSMGGINIASASASCSRTIASAVAAEPAPASSPTAYPSKFVSRNSTLLPSTAPLSQARVTSLPSSSLVDALCSALASARSPQGMAQGRAQGNGGERAVREGGGQAVGLLLEELERRVQTGVGSGVEGLGLVRVRLEEQQSRSSVPSERGLMSGVPVAVGAQISFLRALCNAGRMHEALNWLEMRLAGLVGDREAVEDLWKQLLHAMAAAHPHAPPPPPSPPTHSPRQPPSSPSSTLSPEPSPTSTTTSSSPSAQHPHPYPSSPSPPSSPPAPPPLPLVALTARVVAFSRITGALSDALQAMGDMEAAVVRELQGGHGRIGSGCGLLLERASAVRLKSVRVGAGGKEGIGGIEERHGLSTAAEGAAGAVGAAAARVPEERSARSSDRRGRGMWEARGTWGCNREGAWDGKQLLALISQHEGHETEGVAAESRGESEGAALGGAGEGSGEEARGVSMNRDMGLGLGMGRGMELQGAKEGREWEAVEMGLRVGWNAILNAAAKHGRWDLALAMLQRMVQWGVRPDDYTINALTRAAFASHRPTLAQAIVTAAAVATSTASGEHATRLRFAGNALIRACSKEGRFDNALQVFKAMLADQVPVDTCTLQALLLLAAGPTTPTRWGIKGSGSGGGMGGGGDLVGDWMGMGDGWGGNEMGLRGVRGRRGGEGWGDGEGGAGELEGEAGMGRWKSGDHDHEDMDGETGVSAVGWRDDDAGAVDEEGEGGGTRQREVWQRVAAVEAAMGAAGVRHSAASFCTLSLNHRILLPPSCLFFPFQPAWQVRVLGGAGLCRAMQQHVQWGLSTPDAAGRPLTDTLTLNTAIAAAARLGQVHAARQLFALTEQHPHLTPTTVTFNALLNALAVAAAHTGAGSASARGSRRGGDVLVERDGRWRGGGEWEGEGGETDCVAEVCDVIEEMEERGIEPDTITFNTAIKAACSVQDYKAAHRFLARMEQHPHLTPDQTSYSTAVAFAAFQGNIFHMELFLARLLRQRVPLSFSALASVVEAYAHAIPRRINQVTPATLALAEHSQQVQWEQGGRLEGGQGESKAIEKAEVKRRGRGSAVVSGGEEKGGVAVRSEEGRLMEFARQLAAEVETSGECEEEGGGAARRESVVGWRARIEEQLQQWERALE
ncbi:unnamed protein product [Closterium sp. NIES-65]|nr:unnamed protein product [Closterium sp. NIES-65]